MVPPYRQTSGGDSVQCMDLMDLSPGEGVWITGLKVTNFRSIADLELTFRYRLTLLIGENGAGKTTVLDAVHAVLGLSQFNTNDVRRVYGAVAKTARLELRQSAGTVWKELDSSSGESGARFPPSSLSTFREGAATP